MRVRIKLILIVVIILSQIQANEINDLDSLPLKQYISMVSNDLNMPIVISDEIKEEFTFMIPYESNLSDSDYLKVLVQILKENDLTIQSHGAFFVITRNDSPEEEKKELNFVVLKNVDYETIKPIFKTVSNANHSYISSNKTIAFNSTKSEFTRISTLIKQLDKTPKQLKLKLTIVDTNLDKLKEYGTEFNINRYLTQNTNINYFFNLLAFPFSVNSELSDTKSTQLYSFIKFMDTNNLSNVKSSPLISLFDNKQTIFNIVNNISYVSGTTTTEDTTTKTINTYAYKDVGLKLNVLPRIYENNIYLDIELTIENLLDNSDTPTTSKNYLKQTIKLQKNKIFALSGINQSRTYNNINSTPLLSEVPLLGWLFKDTDSNQIQSNLTIFLEIVDNENISVSDDKFTIDLPKYEDTKNIQQIKHEERVNKILGNKD